MTKLDVAKEIVSTKWKGAKNPPSATMQKAEVKRLIKYYTKEGLETILSGALSVAGK